MPTTPSPTVDSTAQARGRPMSRRAFLCGIGAASLVFTTDSAALGAERGHIPSGSGNIRQAAGGPRGYVTGMASRSPSLHGPDVRRRASALVGELRWDRAQPSAARAGSISAEALATIDNYISTLTDPLRTGKLRVFAGADAPGWAKARGGKALSWVEEFDQAGAFTIPRWFTPAYLDSYESFIAALAKALSRRSGRIKEVTISGAQTIYAEPCIKQFSSAVNRRTAVEAGYTRENDLAAAKRVIDIHHRYMTPLGIVSSFAYNPWQQIGDDGGARSSLTQTLDLMNYQRSSMGPFGVWQNNSLGAYQDGSGVLRPARGATYEALYHHMRAGSKTGHPIQFQTMTIQRMTSGEYGPVTPRSTVQFAIDAGAISVEMPVGGWERNFTNAASGITSHALTAAESAILNGGLAANTTHIR